MEKMLDIPLFPLNTVLFPGTPISLHIFEPRYKDMVQWCLDHELPFGVVLIEEGREALGPLAKPHPVGCTAQISEVEHLPDGRLNVLAVGMDRFQIHSLAFEHDYLTGTVELLPLYSEDLVTVEQAGTRLRPWVERYLSVLASAADEAEFDVDDLPDDPLALGYLAAALVQIPPDEKQPLLATAEAGELLTNMRGIYRREVALLSAMLEREKGQEMGIFSRN
ncbi:LON peptidase substrate-binding domain-containing protein [Aggregatilinea lenta]|uniref:LON peptidase substrate-binding domain-containing protein n=1 Tax=Aggregatilinea lenta TaxID=913108 RepID=UPI0013C2E3D2|nr:LON peptidase substrate-binding domain-containing protein [Aggregatilinea lenta]